MPCPAVTADPSYRIGRLEKNRDSAGALGNDENQVKLAQSEAKGHQSVILSTAKNLA